jgi:hypothetical protein
MGYCEPMRVDANFFCTVPMDDAGKVEPTKRRYDNNAVIECYKNLVAWAKTADEVGIDTMRDTKCFRTSSCSAST